MFFELSSLYKAIFVIIYNIAKTWDNRNRFDNLKRKGH